MFDYTSLIWEKKVILRRQNRVDPPTGNQRTRFEFWSLDLLLLTSDSRQDWGKEIVDSLAS